MTLESLSDRAAVAALLQPLDAGIEPALASLHARLVRSAQESHSLDIAYTVVDSPVGKLLLAATEHGVVRVAFELENHDAVLQLLANTVSPRILHAPSQLEAAARQLDEYFSGTRKDFSLPLDFQLARGFRLNVLHHLPQIAYGSTESYAQVDRATLWRLDARAGAPPGSNIAGRASDVCPDPLPWLALAALPLHARSYGCKRPARTRVP